MMTLLISGARVLDLWICSMVLLSMPLELRLIRMVPQIAQFNIGLGAFGRHGLL